MSTSKRLAAPLGLVSDMLKIAPKAIKIDPLKVDILKRPNEFFEQLRHGIASSQQQISLAALYMGTGELEQRLVKDLVQALEIKPDLHVNILFDHSRGLRGKENNSITVLEGLLRSQHSHRVRASLYQMPQLRTRGGRPLPLPSPINEAVAVQHIKAYVFDNDTLLSGANLSHDYFTDRQDRYLLVGASAGLAGHHHALVRALAAHSARAGGGGGGGGGDDDKRGRAADKHSMEKLRAKLLEISETSTLNQEDSADTVVCAPAAAAAASAAAAVAEEEGEEAGAGAAAAAARVVARGGTWAVPTLQHPRLGLRTDERLTRLLLGSGGGGGGGEEGRLRLSTAYLNLPNIYQNLIYNSPADVEMITAGPLQHGFATATGMKSWIPKAYLALEHGIWSRCVAGRRRGGRPAALWRYARAGWTYHAKGLWLRHQCCGDAHNQYPNLTMIGSSNFGYRSVSRDLESQVVLFTDEPSLQKKLQDEWESLLYHCERPSSTQYEEVAGSTRRFLDRYLNGSFKTTTNNNLAVEEEEENKHSSSPIFVSADIPPYSSRSNGSSDDSNSKHAGIVGSSSPSLAVKRLDSRSYLLGYVAKRFL